MYFVGAMINLRNYSLMRLCFFSHFLDYKRIQSIAFLFPIFGVLHPYKLECGYQSCFGGIVEVFFSLTKSQSFDTFEFCHFDGHFLSKLRSANSNEQHDHDHG